MRNINIYLIILSIIIIFYLFCNNYVETLFIAAQQLPYKTLPKLNYPYCNVRSKTQRRCLRPPPFRLPDLSIAFILSNELVIRRAGRGRILLH